MPGDGKTSRCGWEVLTSGRRERRDEREADEGAGRRPLTSGRREDEGGAGKRERGREFGWERRERGRMGVLSWLNLMSGGDVEWSHHTCPHHHSTVLRWSGWQQFWSRVFLDDICTWPKPE